MLVSYNVDTYHATTTWQDLKRLYHLLYPQQTAALITYFEQTWLNTTYPIEMWNVHESTLQGDPRTNNFSEGGNNSLNQSAGCANPTICKFIEKLQLYNTEAEMKLLQLMTGQPPARKKRNKEVIRQERILRLVQAYDDNSRLSFCRSRGYLYG